MNSEGDWKHQKERGSSRAFAATVFIYKILGRRICSLIIYPVATYFYITGKKSKEASFKYLNKIYNHSEGKKHFSKPPGFRAGHRHFMTFAFSVLDKFAVWMKRITYENIIFPNRDELVNRLKKKQGVVLLSAHYGNVEIMRAVSQTISNIHVNVIMDRRNAESFNKLLKNTNQKFDISIFSSDAVDIGTAALLKEKVENGEIVAVMADRITENSTHRTEIRNFLGEPAHFPQGPFIIPWLLKAPVFMFVCAAKGRKYEVNFEKFYEVDDFPKMKRNVFVSEICDRYVSSLEKSCLKDPWQWYNFYDFWKSPGTIRPDKVDET